MRLRVLFAVVAAAAVVAVAAPTAWATHPPTLATLSVAKTGQGLVTGAGINCGSDCAQTYQLAEQCEFVGVGGGGNHSAGRVQCDPVATDFQVSAAGQNGFGFQGWSDCAESGASCTVSLFGDHTVTAHFADETAPTVALAGPASGSKLHGPVSLSATAADNNAVARVVFRVGGAVLSEDTTAPYQASFTTVGRPEGAVSVSAQAIDASGHVSALSNRDYTIDNTVNASFANGAGVVDEGEHTNAAPALLGFVRDADVPAGNVQCRTVPAAFAACGSPYAANAPGDGAYTVEVRVTDDVGNVRTIARSFVVDRTAPALALTTPGDGSVNNGSFTPAFTVSDAHTPVPTVRCQLDTGQLGACGAVSALAEGDHELTVQAHDQAGNSTSRTNRFRVDRTAPHLAITGGPPEGSVLGTPEATFTFAATDSSALTYQCRADGAAFGACTADDRHALTGLGEGIHSFHVRVVDAAGNASELSRGFVVDAAAPVVEIVDGPAEGSHTAATELTFRFSVADAAEIACSLDSDTAFRPCSGADSDTVAGLGDGAHVFRVRARDAGGSTTIRARTFTVDTARPDTAIDAGPADGSLTTADSATFTFSSAPGSSFRCRFGPIGSPGAFGPCSGPGNTHSARGLAPGQYVFEVFAINALGLADPTAARRTFRLTRSFEVRVANTWSVRGKITRLIDLTVKRVPAGGSVKVACQGRGCKLRGAKARVRNGKARVTPLFRRRNLRTGAVVEIRISAPGAIARIVRFEMQRNKFPKRTDLCRPPGAPRPTSC
jgi:Bacterial Ig domain/Bacterial Ig-like domain